MAATTATVPMLTPNDPKSPKFAGDGRTLVQFLADYGRMADAAKLTPYEKCTRLVGYVSAEVREDVEQYDEYNGLDEATATAGEWTKLETRFLKDYPDAKKVREITRDDYQSFVERSKTRTITTEEELNAYTREFRRYTTKLLKNGLLSKPEISTAFYQTLLRNLGHDLTLALRLKKPDSDDFSIDEIVECATRLIKKRANNTGIGLVFEPLVMAAKVETTNPAPLAGFVKQEEAQSAFQSLMARIETLERERDASKRAGAANQSSAARGPLKCYYCLGEHPMNRCPSLEDDLKRGRCKRDEGGRVVFPDGTSIPSGPGRKLGDEVAEWNQKRDKAGTGASISTMLVEIGEEYIEEQLPQPKVPAFHTEQAEQAWWAAMMDQAVVYQQRVAGRQGLRSQDKGSEKKNDSQRAEPPHAGKEPVSRETDPRAPLPADKAAAVEQGTARFIPPATTVDAREVKEGTARTVPTVESAQPARPQFRVQAPIEREGTAKKIAERILDAQVVCTLEELAALNPEIQRHLRMKVTPRRVNVNSVEDVAAANPEVEVWRYRVVGEDEDTWTPELVTGKPSIPLRYLDCRVGRFEVEGVLDGGAQIVIISKKLWIELGRPIDENFPRLTLEAANNSKNQTVGLCANLEVTICGIPFFLQAHVVEEAPFDLLLGRPFYALANTSEDTFRDGNSCITIRDPNSDLAMRVPTKERSTRRVCQHPHHHHHHNEQQQHLVTADSHF